MAISPLACLRVAILGLGLIASGCASTPLPISLAAPAKRYVSKDYARELERSTRFASILRELDTTLKIYASLRTPRFEAAYVAKYAKMFKLPAAQRAKLALERAASWQKEISFVIVAATHDGAWNDFDQRRSQWRLALENDKGQQIGPSRIVLVRRPSETDRAFFPHLGMFYRLYTVHFPRRLPNGQPLIAKTTKRLVLRATGALGSTELTWRVE